jgi:hypothetical protein
MRNLIVWVFMYSLDGLLADAGTDYWQFCFGLPQRRAELQQKFGLYERAYAHIVGRTAYEAMALAPAAGRPPVLRHHERRPKDRLLPDAEHGRVGQRHPSPLVTRLKRSTS